MELVYLWVEKYKNIHKQGFNFSPRFSCEYDDVKKELTIKENDDYIENFFGENINVTAIVGKNGSGKSSVLNFVRLFLEDSNQIRKSKKSAILLFKKDNNFFPFTINTSVKFQNEKFDNNYKNNIFNDNEIFSDVIFPLLDYSLTYIKEDTSLKNKKLDGYIPEEYPKAEDRDKIEEKLIQIFPSFPNKKNNLDFIFEDLENLKRIFNNLKDFQSSRNIFENFFIPSKIIILINVEQMSRLYKSDKSSKNSKFKRGYKPKYNDFVFLKKTYSSLLNYDDEFLRLLFKKNQLPQFKATININNFKNKALKFNLEELEENEIDYLLELCATEIFKFILVDENEKNLEELSFGEQQILKILNTIYFLVKENKNLIFFLDEIDIGLHPEWQKKIFKYIIDILSQFPEKNFHIILSSHSPFLLSDIPKENIIFVNGSLNKKQTFGANIHTLLSDSFFMEDGLMGEFAKAKINEIIDFHKLIEKNRHIDCLTKIYLHSKQKKFWQTQKIIGEEYLKQVIKNHLVEIEKKLLGKDGAKQEEIKRVEAYLESLKK